MRLSVGEVCQVGFILGIRMPRGSKDGRPDTESLAATGIAGLDDVLNGGLSTGRLYLVEGVPGSGKTTLAMQFLIEGARRGEPVLYITLSETAEELDAVARVARLGPQRHHRSVSCCPARARSSPKINTRCSTRPRSSWRRRRS